MYRSVLAVLLVTAMASCAARGDELIPPLSAIKEDRPRLLLRPGSTPFAISLAQLRAVPQDQEFQRMLGQLKAQDDAAAQAMVWLLTKDRAAADRAVERMRAYRYPGEVDTFHIFGRLTEFGLAYDWLHDYPDFTREIQAEVRANLAPLAEQGIRVANDHMFHNYVWMSAGGVALWAMATAGEDADANRLFERIRERFNRGLYPAWQYLDGLPSEPMGYWSLYVFTPGVLTLMAAQSASETDLVGAVRTRQGAWLDRHFENLVHSTLPDMRYISWGDLQSGPNGSVTHEMAGVIDGVTWALRSPHGARLSRWLEEKRGMTRFHGETAIYYMLYSRQPKPAPENPPLSFLAGTRQSGHFIARSGWDDSATIVTFRCTDHFGDHHHYDQGSFLIWRNGPLAVDPPVYRKIRGPQQLTENHNTLLVGGRPQRPVRGQWFKTVEEFQKNLGSGRKLETGDVLWWHDAGPWAAVAGQFAQAYDEGVLASCVRYVLFLRPAKVVVVDFLRAPAGNRLPPVQWLLHVPAEPGKDGDSLTVSNGKSWLRCRAIIPDGGRLAVSPTSVNTHRVQWTYEADARLNMVHVLEVGDGTTAGPAVPASARKCGDDVEVTLGGQRFIFAGKPEYRVAQPQ